MNHAPHIHPVSSLAGVLKVIPVEAKAILIEGIHSFHTAKTVNDRLRLQGIRKCERTVMIWLKAVREWLGFPGHYPCLTSDTYRGLVQDSIRRNGRPTFPEVISGWQPGGIQAGPAAGEPALPSSSRSTLPIHEISTRRF